MSIGHTPWPCLEVNFQIEGTFPASQSRHVTRLSGEFLNREGATCCQGVFEVKDFIIRCSSRSWLSFTIRAPRYSHSEKGQIRIRGTVKHDATLRTYGCDGLMGGELEQNKRQRIVPAMAAPAPISSHFPLSAGPDPPGGRAAPQAADSSRAAC